MGRVEPGPRGQWADIAQDHAEGLGLYAFAATAISPTNASTSPTKKN